MGKKRVYELAKELAIPSKKLVDLAQKNKIEVLSHMSVLSDQQEAQLTHIVKGQQPVKKAAKTTPTASPNNKATKTKIKVTAIRRTEKKKVNAENHSNQ
ncbi:MAG: translation initiation factor IF-2 N-terminal domain-containing protein, partial [Bombilactobacillus mellis]|nr:translation initiation factor IF-2 N-terminal domain-containing protein [Bombilactobacillus mellis]